ncbi:MAG: UvrD-helicase domain-containing protein [Thermoflexales bacterium]
MYCSGRPGLGKTTRLIERLQSLITRPVRPDRILVLVPQQAQVERFRQGLAALRSPFRGEPIISTFYHLAQREVALFFPTIANQAGFSEPYGEPVFLNVEATHYLLSKVVEPQLTLFSELRLATARIVAQISDAMNKLAESGLPLSELSERLALAWPDDPSRHKLFQAAQDLAQQFREFCLRHGLIDFSLKMTLFKEHLLSSEFYQDYARARYRYLLVDNVEENVPVMHDFLRLLLPSCEEALLVEDDPGSLRYLLGSDPRGARALRECCNAVETLGGAAEADQRAPVQFGFMLKRAILEQRRLSLAQASHPQRLSANRDQRYWTDMVSATVEAIAALRDQGFAPSDIVVLAPYVEDVLVFTLSRRLHQLNIGVQTLRPSRPLHQHPIARALIALARLAYPELRVARSLSEDEVALALHGAIAELDLIRAKVLCKSAFKFHTQRLELVDEAKLWTQIGFTFREPFQELQGWLTAYAEQNGAQPLDRFWQQLFVEKLSRPGFAMCANREAATVCYKLIASAQAFRNICEQAQLNPETLCPFEQADVQAINRAWLKMLEMQLMPRQFAAERSPLQSRDPNSVLLSTAYAWATSDLRARVQIWLDVQSNSWHQRPYQQLTHPFVLSRHWPLQTRWTDADELVTSRDMLARLCSNLAFRCEERVLVAASQLTLKGDEERGLLERALRRLGV